jgi:hypothetical protein
MFGREYVEQNEHGWLQPNSRVRKNWIFLENYAEMSRSPRTVMHVYKLT